MLRELFKMDRLVLIINKVIFLAIDMLLRKRVGAVCQLFVDGLFVPATVGSSMTSACFMGLEVGMISLSSSMKLSPGRLGLGALGCGLMLLDLKIS